MAEDCQSHAEGFFDKPSLRTKTGDEVTALIKRGLTLANEVEARLSAQTDRSSSLPQRSLHQSEGHPVRPPAKSPINPDREPMVITQVQADLPLPTPPVQEGEGISKLLSYSALPGHRMIWRRPCISDGTLDSLGVKIILVRCLPITYRDKKFIK